MSKLKDTRKKQRPVLTIQERVKKLIRAAQNDPGIMNDDTERENLKRLVEHIASEDAFVHEVQPINLLWEFPPYWFDVSNDLSNPVDYDKYFEERGAEVSTEELAMYFDCSKEALKQSIRDATSKPGKVVTCPCPLPLKDCGEIFITELGGKGRGNSHKFRRCKHEAFNFLDDLLGIRPAMLCPELKVDYGSSTVREILWKARDMRDNPLELTDWMLPLMESYDVFATEDYGLIVADGGDGIQRILQETEWVDRDHVRLLRILRGVQRMSWSDFESNGLGMCTGFRWHALVFDLHRSRHQPSFPERSDES